MMAVRVPAGSSEIRFDYKTPGLTMGILMTGGGFILWGVYLLILCRRSRQKPLIFGRSQRHAAALCKVDDIPLEDAYIDTILREAEHLQKKPRTLTRF